MRDNGIARTDRVSHDRKVDPMTTKAIAETIAEVATKYNDQVAPDVYEGDEQNVFALMCDAVRAYAEITGDTVDNVLGALEECVTVTSIS